MMRLRTPLGITLVLSALSLVLGLACMAYYHPNRQYEYFGLLRIMWELGAREGFWLVALGAFVVGFRRKLPRFSQREWVRHSVSAVVLAVLLHVQPVYPIATYIDAVSLAVLLLVFYYRLRGHVQGREYRVIVKDACTVGLTFVSFSLVAYWHSAAKAALFLHNLPVDASFLSFDQSMLFGADSLQRMQQWRTNHVGLTGALDWVYIALLQQLGWVGFYFMAGPNPDSSRYTKYLAALLLSYFLAPLVYFSNPSMGPAFFHPEYFTDLILLAPDSAQLQAALQANTAMAVYNQAGVVETFGTIAAFPSLHVGVSVLALIAVWPDKIARAGAALAMLATWCATVLLGWHYFVDGIVGAVLCAGSWFAIHAVISRRSAAMELPTAGVPQPMMAALSQTGQ